MSGRSGGRSAGGLVERVARWRAEHGGRGVRWPPELWAAVIAEARIEGVAPVARRLGVGPERLAARIARADAASLGRSTTAPSAFVEVDAGQLYARSRTVIRFEGDGRRVELELGEGVALDLVALARAFWSSGG